MFKSFVLFHASLTYPANTLKYLNREDTKHTFLYFTDFEVIPAEVNAIKQILNKQDSTRPIYTFIALRTIILQSVHGVNKSLSFIIKHADICSYHRKNTWNTSLPAHNGILNKTCQVFFSFKTEQITNKYSVTAMCLRSLSGNKLVSKVKLPLQITVWVWETAQQDSAVSCFGKRHWSSRLWNKCTKETSVIIQLKILSVLFIFMLWAFSSKKELFVGLSSHSRNRLIV